MRSKLRPADIERLLGEITGVGEKIATYEGRVEARLKTVADGFHATLKRIADECAASAAKECKILGDRAFELEKRLAVLEARSGGDQ